MNWCDLHDLSTRQAGFAPKEAEKKKCQKYSRLSQYYFCSLGFETTGGFGKSCLKIVKEIEIRIAEKSGDPRSGDFTTT